MKSLAWIYDEARRLIDRDTNLRTVQRAMDRIANLQYELPEALSKLAWMRKVVSTAPYEAIQAAARTLSGKDEILTIEPISVYKGLRPGVELHSPAARAKANEWERALTWQMARAARRQPSFRSDVNASATKYDEIVGQVIYMPAQIHAVKVLERSSTRYESAMRFGDFTVIIKNPQTVHTVFSPYQLEAVLCIECYTGAELKNIWGPKAAGLDDALEYVQLDYHSLEERHVLVYPGDNESDLVNFDPDGKRGSDLLVIIAEENKHPYIPWVCKIGGTSLEALPENQRRPLLYAVYAAELWVTDAITRSLAVSKEIATAAEPRNMIEGPTPEAVETNYTEPGGRVEVPPGHKFTPLPPSPLDPKQFQVSDRIEQAIRTSTVASLLVTAEAQAGEAYSTFNTRAKLATGSLAPYKKLAEAWFEDVFRTMLYCCHYHQGVISGYATDRKAKGQLQEIVWSEIDPACIYLNVEITPDIPIDMLQQINGAVMAIQNLQLSPIAALEWLGIPDPEAGMLEWEYWQYMLSEIKGNAERIQKEASGQYEQDIQAAAQAMVEQQMQAQQEQQAPPQLPPPAQAGAIPGGPGFAPPMGGLPPAMANPQAGIRENVNGRDRAGASIQ